MKKIIQIMAILAVSASFVVLQSCKEDDPAIPPTLTAPTAVTSVQVGTKADVTFTFTAPEGYFSSEVTATGGQAIVKTPPAADAKEGSIVVEFTADATAGAASVSLTLTDAKDQKISQTAVLNKTISPPPALSLSAATGSTAAGTTINVTVTITAANGAKNISYTTTGGLTASPASPVTISGSPTAATAQVFTLSVPATAAAGSTLTAVFTGQDNQNLNSTAVTFTVTVSDVANVITGTPTADVTLTAGTPWTVKGQYIIENGRTLRVNAGAIVKGDKATKGVIIIKPGGTLIADGTATNPIVFTSSQPANERDRGDWGGIVWLGSAFVNQTSPAPTVEGITPAQAYGTPSTASADAGGAANTANNGTLRYVRIEYAGIELSPNNETNSLTMGGLGSGTTIDYVQVSYGGDDGFEWFGGTVNAKHLISFGMWDDDFDTDFGWRGNVQYGLVVRAPFIADQSGSTAFESDSGPNANAIGSICTDTEKAGCTRGVFSNITVLGPREYSRGISGSYTRAIHLRRRTAISIFNSVVTGFLEGIRMDDQGTSTNYSSTYDAANTSLGKLANNELYVSLLPNVPSDLGSTATAVASIGNATGNNVFSVGGGLTPSTFAQSLYRATGAGNNDYAPVFIAQWVRNADGVITGQTMRNNWQATAATILDGDDPNTTTVEVETIARATGINTVVNGVSAGAWTDGTNVSAVNPYTGSGLRTAPFYAGSSNTSYPSNPDFTLDAAGATGGTKSLNANSAFTDAKLPSAFFEATTFRGAFSATANGDWTDGWAEFIPVTKAY